MEEMIRDFAGIKPILGICLGHQAIAEVFGGRLGLAPQVMHGKQSQIRLEAPSPLYAGVAKEVPVMRYHSLTIEDMPEEFVITSRTTDDGAIMGIQHRSLPIYGFQYHPESIGTPDGLKTIENFVKLVMERGAIVRIVSIFQQQLPLFSLVVVSRWRNTVIARSLLNPVLLMS